MNRCPQCQYLFDKHISRCPNDRSFLMPDLPPTVEYINPYVSNPTLIKTMAFPRFAPVPPVNEAQPPRKKPDNYAGFLLVGLLLGCITIASLFVIVRFFSNAGNNVSAAVPRNVDNPSKGNAQTKPANDEIKPANAEPNRSSESAAVNKPVNAQTPEKPANVYPPKDTLPAANTDVYKKPVNNFNGRVIMMNAFLRSAPDMNAPEVTVLPLSSPITIGKQASPNSPWFRVKSEDGAVGWMHGNTIEYTR